MAIQKISRDSISDQVFVQMKEQILEGEWKPGEKFHLKMNWPGSSASAG